ncbi:hypothetical protein BXZ70DRAFT_294595 [Cristinia sonorae]|uniref:Uncharacterized protein n=1 Tax=Cristinia sonorae TaxID=1940300 RepID=A0A8K0UKT9_9AGAR|nr:hypothetical protein BXZ70DRAFT_294595 [Cristinia sonorae]
MDPSHSLVDCGQANPDISGIGVRLSFYLQNFLLVLLVDRSWEDAPNSLWTFTSTSFGLTISAIVQAQQGQLSFFQALQVTNLVWMANFGSFLALASYSRHRTIKGRKEATPEGNASVDIESHRVSARPKSNNLVKLAAMSQMFFSMALTLVTWARPDIFSNDADDSTATCDVVYVAFFGASFPARHSGRILGLTVTGILLAGYLFITVHELYAYYTRKSRHKSKGKLPELVITPAEKENIEMRGSVPFPTPTPFLEPGSSASVSSSSRSGSVTPSHASDASHAGGERRHRRRRPKQNDYHRTRRANWGKDLDPMLVGLTIFQVLVGTYFIVCTELLLDRNPISDHSDQDWGFGQIMALILVVPSFISFFHAFREHRFGNLHHAKTKVKTVRSRRARSRSRNVNSVNDIA